MPFGNYEEAQAGPISLRKPLRRPEKRRDGDMSAEPRGPTTSPHGDFGGVATLFRLMRARPAPQVFFANGPTCGRDGGQFPKGIGDLADRDPSAGSPAPGVHLQVRILL